MTVNMGKLDRGLRLAVAAALFILAAATTVGDGTWLEWLFYGLGAVALLTALVGNCPLYRVLGIKTCTAC
ncbi:YgaP family membrane protein [Jiella marina]|uniref:YgaP family membrane protein n=1 Tax=Jiella sp. LLJ827 TaxID=2917712 RepID=UPI0021017051|nr:DUF2892 domain-containing protein [Jiella sp. LLJ827]MCQ0988197.1 DUF2892 domain-containing protein [Jiella sp. LLJ827]